MPTAAPRCEFPLFFHRFSSVFSTHLGPFGAQADYVDQLTALEAAFPALAAEEVAAPPPPPEKPKKKIPPVPMPKDEISGGEIYTKRG